MLRRSPEGRRHLHLLRSEEREKAGEKDSAGLGVRHWSAASPVTRHGIRLAVEENTQMAVSRMPGPFRSPVAAGGSSPA